MGVCVVGSINRDVVLRVPALPVAGATVAVAEQRRLPGGKGANQAVAAARAGAPTRMIAAVGDDADGADLVRFLGDQGVDVAGVARDAAAPTGTAYVAVDDAGENQILVVAGANARLGAQAAATVGAGDAVVLAQLEVPVAAIRAAFAAAHAAGGRTILNIAPALGEGAALFDLADILILNQTELAFYLGAGAGSAEGAVRARDLLTRPGQQAIVTLGAGGVALVGHDGVTHLPGHRVTAVDSTGAGDCFCGTLAAHLAEGLEIERALARANAAAALCVGREGAAPAMPARAEVDAFLAEATEGARTIKSPAIPAS